MVAVGPSGSDRGGGGVLAVRTAGRAWGNVPVAFLQEMLIARLKGRKKPLHKIFLYPNFIQTAV